MGSSSPQYFLLAILLLLLRARPAWDFPQSCGVWRSGARIDSIYKTFSKTIFFSQIVYYGLLLVLRRKFAGGGGSLFCWWGRSVWWYRPAAELSCCCLSRLHAGRMQRCYELFILVVASAAPLVGCRLGYCWKYFLFYLGRRALRVRRQVVWC